MADRRKFNIKREKVICTEGWRVEGREIQSHHNIPVAEYGEKWKTIMLVIRDVE